MKRWGLLAVLSSMLLALLLVAGVQAQSGATDLTDSLVGEEDVLTAPLSPDGKGGELCSTIIVHKFNDKDINGVQGDGEESLAGWTMKLYKWSDYYHEWRYVDSKTTNTAGDAIFSYVDPGYYYRAREVLQSGWTNTTPNPSASVYLPSGGEKTIRFGNVRTDLGSIGDYVWHDADGQGDQDEPAANGLANIRVRLLNGAQTEVLQVDTTDTDGYYLFVDLPAGDYVVDVNEQDVVDSYDLPTLTTNNEPYPYPLASGEHHRDADFGYWAPPGKVALGDYVWHDFNSNGQQDIGEEPQNAGVRCISVFLYDANGNYLDRTNTDSWGIYMFYGLDPGTYTTAVHSTDPDLEQINGILTCSLNDGTPPLTLTSAQQRAPLAVFFTTATDLTFGVAPAGAVVLDFDYGISSTPLAVILAGFEAQQFNDRVLVTWETVSEADNAGFNLYRADDAAGPQTLLATVPSHAPGSTAGFAYSYEDLAVLPGQTYWYWLEDVSLGGATTLHGPVSATVQAPTAVTLSGISASPAAGSVPAAGVLLALLAPLAGAAWALRRRP